MGMDPSSIGSAISGIGTGMLPQIIKWIGITLISACIIGGFYLIYLFFCYNILVYKLILGQSGDGKDKQYFIKSIKALKARRVINRGVEKWKYMFSFFSTPPIPERNIIPFGGITSRSASFVYEVGRNIFVPSALGFTINSPAMVHFSPLPYDVKRAAALELQEIAKDYQDPGFMAKFGSQVFGFLIIVFSIILVLAVIWMTYKYIGGELGNAANSAKSLADSMKNVAVQQFKPGG